jgi:hypothetical protein
MARLNLHSNSISRRRHNTSPGLSNFPNHHSPTLGLLHHLSVSLSCSLSCSTPSPRPNGTAKPHSLKILYPVMLVICEFSHRFFQLVTHCARTGGARLVLVTRRRCDCGR